MVPPTIRLEPLTRLTVTLGAPLDLGSTPQGHRRIVPITGGRAAGDQLSGDLLPGGADWQVVHPGGWVRVHARYTLRLDDGTLVSVTADGSRHGPPEVMARLLAGEPVPAEHYAFRTAVRLETAAEGAHDWLNRVVVVAAAVRDPAAVVQDLFVLA